MINFSVNNVGVVILSSLFLAACVLRTEAAHHLRRCNLIVPQEVKNHSLKIVIFFNGGAKNILAGNLLILSASFAISNGKRT